MSLKTPVQMPDEKSSIVNITSGVLQIKVEPARISDDCRRRRYMLQRRAISNDGLSEVPPIVHEVLSSPGQPLDEETRAFFEPRFVYDFSKVRVHTDRKASESAHALNALAYTVGHDVVFGAGQFAPTSIEGKKLFAHELSHVTQQERRGGSIKDTEDDVERETDRAEVQAVQSGGAMQAFDPVLLTTPLRVARKSKDPRIGGITSKTKPAYTIDDIKKRLSVYNLGPEKGEDVVKALDTQGWQIFFWAQDRKMGLTLSDSKSILLPRDKDLMANVSTLFHEAMHVIYMLAKSAGSPMEPEAVWQNIEEEVRAQYKEILFLQAHAATEPELVLQSNFDKWWSWLKNADQKKIYDWYKDEHLSWIIFSKLIEYRYVLNQYGNDIDKMATSPRAIAILNRVILGQVPKPTLSPPMPMRPKFPPFIFKPRESFQREVLRSAEEL